MNEQYEKWLDEQLKKTVDSGKVYFDSEKWKRKYSAEYEELVSRAGKRPSASLFLWVRLLVRVAAVLAVGAIVMFLTHHRSEKHITQPVAMVANTVKSPADMLSVLSLSHAYQHGGLDAVDEQCKKAYELLGQKNTNVSIGELLNENGSKPERKDL